MSQVLIIIDIAGISQRIMPILAGTIRNYHIPLTDIESTYDWLIAEALEKILSSTVAGHVRGHSRHDIYRCIYDEIGSPIEHYVRQVIAGNGLQFLEKERVKVLVTYKDLVVVRSTFDGVL